MGPECHDDVRVSQKITIDLYTFVCPTQLQSIPEAMQIYLNRYNTFHLSWLIYIAWRSHKHTFIIWYADVYHGCNKAVICLFPTDMLVEMTH